MFLKHLLTVIFYLNLCCWKCNSAGGNTKPPFVFGDCKNNGASYQYGNTLICYWVDFLLDTKGSHCGSNKYAWVPNDDANYIVWRVADENLVPVEQGLYIGCDIAYDGTGGVQLTSSKGEQQGNSNFLDGFSTSNTCVQVQDKIWNDVNCSTNLLAVCFWEVGFNYGDCRPDGVSYVSSTHQLCYWIDETPQISTDACGGNYSVIPNKDAQRVVNKLLEMRSLTGTFNIGYKNNDETLKTHNGIYQSWANWADEPEDDTRCVTLQTPYGRWNTISCQDLFPSICSSVFTRIESSLTTANQEIAFIMTSEDSTTSAMTSDQSVFTSDVTSKEPISTSAVKTQEPISTSAVKTEESISTSAMTSEKPVFTSAVTSEKPIFTSDLTTKEPVITTAQSSQEPSSTFIMSVVTENGCLCECQSLPAINWTMDISERVKELESILLVDKKTLSSTVRSRTSAKDPRVSSAYLGYAGILILVSMFTIIIIFDVLNFAIHFVEKSTRVKRKIF